MVVTLEFIDGPFPPNKKSISLTAGESIRIGRRSICDIYVPDPSISGKHFSLDVSSDQPKLIDLGSRNGTLVNGEKAKSCPVNDGDEILVGKTRFRITVVSDVESSIKEPDESVVLYVNHPPANSPNESSSNKHGPAYHDRMFDSLDVHTPVDETMFHSLDANEPLNLAPFNFDSAVVIKPASDHAPTPSPKVEVDPDTTTSDLPSPQETLRSIPLSVVLDVKPGAGEEDEIRIRSGQIVAIGSSSSADFSFNRSNLRPRHFKIECNHKGVFVRCFDKNWPVTVNGVQHSKVQLFNNDLLIAGIAEFHVTLQGDDEVICRPDDATEPITVETKPIQAANVKKQKNKLNASVIQFETSSAKAVRVEGEISAVPMINLLDSLLTKFKAYLLIDFFRMQQTGLPTKEQQSLRISKGTSGVGAYLIPIHHSKEMEHWSEQIEDSDCGMVLFAKSEHDEFRKQLCSITTNDQPVCNVCWPSVMRIILESGDSATVNKFVEVVHFIVAESDSPGHWSIYCNKTHTNQLRKLGLTIQANDLKNSTKENSNA